MTSVTYFVIEGFHSKLKAIITMLKNEKHLITKLRQNANLHIQEPDMPSLIENYALIQSSQTVEQ